MMHKRLWSIILAACMVLTLLPITRPAAEVGANTGETIPGSSGGERDDAYTSGIDARTVNAASETPYSRAEWLQAIEELFNLTADPSEYPDVYFPDIEGDYYDVVMIATVHGLADTEAGDDFRPGDVLTRDYAVHTLNFLLGMEKTSESYTFSDSGQTEYPDDAQAVLDAGWLDLVDGEFQPEQPVTASERQTLLDGAKEVLDRRNNFQPGHEYEFASYVKELPAEAEVEVEFDMNTGSRTLTVSNYEDTLAVGDVFVYYYDEIAFVYTAKSVEQTDGAYIVETEDAPEGAILKYQCSGTVSPEITSFSANNEPVTLMDADGSTVTFGKTRVTQLGKKIDFTKDVLKSNGLSGTLSGVVYLDTLDYDIGFPNGYLVLNGTIEITSTIKLDLLNDPSINKGLELGTVSLGPFGGARVVLDLNMKAEMSYHWKASYQAGVEVFNGRGALIKNVEKDKDNSFSAKGEVSAQLALIAEIEIPAIAEASARLSAGPVITMGMRTYASGSPRKCINISGYLSAGLQMDASFFGEHLKGFPKKITILNEKNSPIKVGEHIEDGVTVKSCTRSKDAGTTTGSYKVPKYVSPANSRFYSSSNPNGSSTWGGGSAEPVVIWKTSDNDDGTVTITSYQGNASVLNIPETIDGKTVTVIGNNAFKNNANIRIITIPDTVTRIGYNAFNGCKNLQTVQFGKAVTEINNYAFENCISLLAVELPESLTTVGGESFGGCTALESVYIPSALTEAASTSGSFRNCSSLDNVTFGKSIASIPNGLFRDCTGLTHIEIPDTVTRIGYNAFNGCKNLQTVQFGKAVTEINNYAFENCISLLAVELPESLTTVGGESFGGCTALESVYIPSALTEAASTSGAFRNCSSLDNVTFGESIASIPNGLFRDCTGLMHIEIPDTVTRIGYNAFNGCTNLQTIQFGKNVSEINNYAFCNSGLVTVTIPDTITQYPSGELFSNCKNLVDAKLSNFAMNIPSNMFSGCTSLKTVEIPDGVTKIRSNTFRNCTSLESLDFLPKSVTSIESNAFSGCTGLTSAKIPKLVTSLDGDVFSGCTALTAFEASPVLKSIGGGCFQDCAALKDVFLNKGLETIGSNAFQNCAALEEIILPDSVTSIGTYCFQKDPKLSKVILSANMKEIPSYAFANCLALERIDIPEGITTVKDHAFYQNTGLNTFYIPQSVTAIQDNAISYPLVSTVYGISGSYAETYAKWKEFIPLSGNEPVTGVLLNKKAVRLKPGEEITLTAGVEPAYAADKSVNWTSSDKNVAEVDAGGRITAAALGQAEITVTTASGGKTAVCEVVVTNAETPPPSRGLSAYWHSDSGSVVKGELVIRGTSVDKWYMIEVKKVDEISSLPTSVRVTLRGDKSGQLNVPCENGVILSLFEMDGTSMADYEQSYQFVQEQAAAGTLSILPRETANRTSWTDSGAAPAAEGGGQTVRTNAGNGGLSVYWHSTSGVIPGELLINGTSADKWYMIEVKRVNTETFVPTSVYITLRGNGTEPLAVQCENGVTLNMFEMDGTSLADYERSYQFVQEQIADGQVVVEGRSGTN